MRIQETRIVEIDGKIINAVYEIDTNEDRIINQHLNNIRIEKELTGTSLSSSKNSTIGKGKKTGNMAKASQARNYKGTMTRTGTRKRNSDKINSYNLDETSISNICLNQF